MIRQGRLQHFELLFATASGIQRSFEIIRKAISRACFLKIACQLMLQTGQYSTQIFSLAVLLSSLFVFNQMGGIDEAALDRLSLVTEMTKHIRVRASGGDTYGSTEHVFCWQIVICASMYL